MKVERIGVAGAGTMGAGIAQLASLSRFDVYLHDPDPDALASGEERLRADLVKGADRGRWTRSEAEAASARLRTARDLGGLGRCELVIEAAPEDLELKRKLFAGLAETCGPDAVLATNTSSLRVGEIAAGIERPERICGMHFFNPPPLMPLVEIVAAQQTTEETIEVATAVAEQMRRRPIQTTDEVGFIANRCSRPFTLEALHVVGERIATPMVVDRIMRVGGGYRMGPFEVIDVIGVDVNLEVSRSLYEQSGGEPRWRPHRLQARLVAEGRLGRKSGHGFYAYRDGDAHRPEDPQPPDPDPELVPPPPGPAPVLVTASGARAHPLERSSLAKLGAGERTVGYTALPTLAEARLVELTRTQATLDGAAEDVEAHFRGLGKDTQWVGDTPGLVLGRIIAQLVNEACYAVSERVGTPDDVDAAMRLGYNHPRGPFEWAEAIGPARVLAILEALGRELGDDRYRVAPFLRRWVTETPA